MRRHATTIGRALALGAALGGLALADVVLVALTAAAMVLLTFGLIFFFMPTTRLIRHRTMLARRLTGRWLGVEVPPSYRPPPPPPRPQPDGWYRHERQLYKTPRWPAWNNRLNWMFTDPATWRDGLWLFLNPLVGGVLLLLPLGALGSGLAMPWYWAPQAAPLGVSSGGTCSKPRPTTSTSAVRRSDSPSVSAPCSSFRCASERLPFCSNRFRRTFCSPPSDAFAPPACSPRRRCTATSRNGPRATI